MLAHFYPVISGWFGRKFGEPTDVQRRAWAEIVRGAHTLIAAPTGSGKTLAALLPLLDNVLKEKLASGDRYERGVRVLYITPLKALNNDIHQHLFDFIDELRQEAEDAGETWPGLSVGVRTGDTSQSTRASMLRRPPDVLVTTPESLCILLTSLKARDILRTIRHVVVDEIHSLAGGDRGLHLSVSLERLAELCGVAPQRIGVSATQKPPERIARYLGGWEEREEREEAAEAAGERTTEITTELTKELANEALFADGLDRYVVPEKNEDGCRWVYVPRPVTVVESRMDRSIELCVAMPQFQSIRGKNEDVWTPVVRALLDHIEGAGTTIVFVNNRRLCERLTARMNEMAGEGFSRSHHGSVSRERRLETERMLRDGEMRCLVATSSLELGIDVGFVDLVLQIDSPQSAASGIQRIGRAGHAVGGVSRGMIIARSRGVLPEIAVLAERIARRDTEEIAVPRHAVGVLAQQIVAIVAADDRSPDGLYRLILRSDSYRGFPRGRFDELLAMLSGYYPFVKPLIEWDRQGNKLIKRPNSGMAAVMGAGTIPQSTGYPVYHAENRVHLGELDEEFVFESRVGDVFQLGASTWRIRSIREDRVDVVETDAAFGEIPFWRAEGPGRSCELGVQIGETMERLIGMLPEGTAEASGADSATAWLVERSRFTNEAAESLIGLLKSQRAVSAWPTHRRIVIEWFTDDSGLTHIVIHSWFGRKFNLTWLIALRRHLEKSLETSFETTAKDNGIELIFREWDPAWLQLLQGVNSQTLEPLLLEAIPTSPLFAATFRKTAETSLLLARSFRRTPAWLKRLRSQELLRDALPLAAKFPLVKETLRECLEQSLDIRSVRNVFERMESGEIDRVVIHCMAPSPLAAQFFFEFLNKAIYESDSLTRDLHQRMMGVSRELAAEVFGKEALAQSVHEEVLAEERARLEEGADAVLREERDVVRLLKERGDLSPEEWRKLSAGSKEAGDWLEKLRSRGEVKDVVIADEPRFICGDEAQEYERLSDSPGARNFVLVRYIETVVSFTAEQLSQRYALPLQEMDSLIADWALRKLIVPAPFAEEKERGKLWTGAKAASRMIRASLFRARGTRAGADRYCAMMLSRHHLAADRKLRGPEGVRAALDLLQGVFLPLSWWESVILPARVADYRREDLDLLCASGEIFWIGRKEEGAKEGTVAFFRHDAVDLYAPCVAQNAVPLHPDLYARLKSRGACFLTTLGSDTGEQPSELMPKLLDLVWQGLIGCDQFAPLRLHGSGRGPVDRTRFRSGLGRWYAVDELAARLPDQAEKSVLAWANHLLRMNGIVTKPVANEQSPYAWEAISTAYGKMEEWGLVTRGLLVSSVNYLQFADKETAEILRQPPLARRSEGVTLLSSVDPANPYGLSVDWPETAAGTAFSRKPGNYMLFHEEKWLLWVENKGRKLTSLRPNDADGASLAASIRQLAAALLREHGLRKVVIETWNGEPVGETPIGSLLAGIGAEKDGKAYVIWPSVL